eukprot:Seg4959.1 transcript_id=Seg4959.1/GoldUCD/mRNA.D3Y31 product="hypothetical protein" protein_id=Seg4959.1/GoldUCD/D3Y31
MEDSRSPARSHECRDFADPSSMVQSPPPPYGGSPAASLTDMNGNGKTDDRSNSFRFPADNIPASHSNNPEEHRGPSNVYNNFLDVMEKMADNVNNQLEMLRDEKILNRMLWNTIDILRDDNENKAIRINELERTIEIMNNQSQESTVTKCSDHRSHDNGQGQPEFILESQENQKTPAEVNLSLDEQWNVREDKGMNNIKWDKRLQNNRVTTERMTRKKEETAQSKAKRKQRESAE